MRSLGYEFVQSILLIQDEVPEIIILKSQWLDNKQRIGEKKEKHI